MCGHIGQGGKPYAVAILAQSERFCCCVDSGPGRLAGDFARHAEYFTSVRCDLALTSAEGELWLGTEGVHHYVSVALPGTQDDLIAPGRHVDRVGKLLCLQAQPRVLDVGRVLAFR